MRIAVVHSFYSRRSPSGENEAVVAQARALESAGHDVLLVARSTDAEERRPLYATRAGIRVATGRGGDPSAELMTFRPDVVHVHNLFPNLGTRWLTSWQGPIVATLHNFRLACANGVLFRDGAVCTDCPDGRPLSGLIHGCYRGSRVATLPLTIANVRGMSSHPLIRRADRLIALSERSRSEFARFGAPRDRLVVIPHFVDDRHKAVTPAPVEARFLAVGRLAAEKGFEQLVAAWPPGQRLDVVGDGPEADALARLDRPGVRLLGRQTREEWREAAGDYTGLVFPSLWSEGALPLTVLEAWEASLPVIARTGSAAADAVEATGAGFTYADDASLQHALTQAFRRGGGLRATARRAYEGSHRPDAWLAATTDLYASVAAGA